MYNKVKNHMKQKIYTKGNADTDWRCAERGTEI